MIDTDTLEELKIIAKDGGRLSERDKQIIAQAVTQLEALEKLLFNANRALIDANKALTDGRHTMAKVHAQLEATQHWPYSNYSRITLRLGPHEQASVS